MKKIALLVAMVVVMMLCLPAVASADIIDDAINYVKAQQVKAGVFYEVQDQELYQTAGATLAQDVRFDGLDIALYSDLDKAVLVGIDYTIKKEGISPYIGIAAGLDRIEKIKRHEMGEFKIGVSAGAKF